MTPFSLLIPAVAALAAILLGPDTAVAPTGRETPEENASYRRTGGNDALVFLIPVPVFKFLPKAATTVVSKAATKSPAKAITAPYKRPSNATTAAQRKSVQGKPCVTCGKQTSKQVANHKTALVKEYYKNGKIDEKKMRSVKAVNSQCPTCSQRQGADLSRYSRKKKEEIKPKE